MSTNAPKMEKDSKEDKNHLIKVINGNDGESFDVHAGSGETIEKIIAKIYTELGQPRSNDDRLTCNSGGESIYPFVELKLKEFLEQGHCPSLIWKWTGPTGGA